MFPASFRVGTTNANLSRSPRRVTDFSVNQSKCEMVSLGRQVVCLFTRDVLSALFYRELLRIGARGPLSKAALLLEDAALCGKCATICCCTSAMLPGAITISSGTSLVKARKARRYSCIKASGYSGFLPNASSGDASRINPASGVG